MAIANTVVNLIHRIHADYQVVRHPYTNSSLESAMAAHITSEKIAKAVLLKDKRGYVLAVIQANHELDFQRIEQETGRRLYLASETELATIFPDCELGAVPAIGPAYGLETIVDLSLRSQADIYFASGDHKELIHMSESLFESMLEGASYKCIAKRIIE